MNTIVYLTRHTKPDKARYIKSGNELEQNKSIELSEYGIEKAKEFFDCFEFSDIDNVYCSDYVRSFETGKLLNKNVVIDSRLGERMSGIPDLTISPNEYFYKQVIDENYKFKFGESKKEIIERMYEALIDIIGSNKGKKVLVVSHGTSMTFLLMKLCGLEIINVENKIRRITFNNKVIFEDKFHFLETFKLIFDENNNLIDIISIGGIYEDM